MTRLATIVKLAGAGITVTRQIFAINALENMGHVEGKVEAFVTAAGSFNRSVSLAAASALKKLGTLDHTFTGAVRLLVASGTLHVRQSGVEIAALLGPAGAVLSTDLIALLGDEDSDVRAGAVKALAAVQAKDSIGAIGALLGAPELSVRIAAVQALGTLGGVEAIRLLQSLPADAPLALRVYAAKAAVRAGG